MAKISLSYPDTGLTISISVKNRDTGVEDFSGTMTEVGTTREYKYDFTETVDTDYVYVATVAGYSNMSGVVYRDGGGLTTEQSTKLDRIYTNADIKISQISITGGIDLSGLRNQIERMRNNILENAKQDISPVLETINKLDEILQTKLGQIEDYLIEEKKYRDKVIKKELIETLKEKQEHAREEEEKQKELDIILETIQTVEAEHEKNIIDSIKMAEEEHERNIKEALKNL